MLQTLKNHQKSVVTTCAIFRLTCGQGILVADASTKAYGGVHQKSLPTLGTTRDFEVRVQCKILIDQRVRRHICVPLCFIGRVIRRLKSLSCWKPDQRLPGPDICRRECDNYDLLASTQTTSPDISLDIPAN